MGKARRVRHEHPTRVGEHYYEGLDDEGTWSPWAEYVDRSYESRYGDPELAMISAETPVEELDWDEHYSEVQRVWACLNPIDRLVLHLSVQGTPQVQIGQMLGITQSSVCTRLQRIIKWGAHVVPFRMAARGEPEPERWLVRRVSGGLAGVEQKAREAREAWRLCVWAHLSTVDVSRIMGVSQGQAHRAIHDGCEAVITAGQPGLSRMAKAVRDGITSWTRPQISGVARFNDFGLSLVMFGRGDEMTTVGKTQAVTGKDDPRRHPRYLELRRGWMLREWEHDFLDELDLVELDALGVIDLEISPRGPRV